MLMIEKNVMLVASLSLFLFCSGCQKNEESKQTSESPKEISNVEEPVQVKNNLKAMVRYVAGEAMFKRAEKDWVPLQIGRKVVENDRVRTELESEADISVVDGSILKIIEKSTVLFSVDSLDGEKKLVIVDVNKGRVHFDIQKQKNREYKFKTGTAAVAIRGTAGFVGNVNGKTVASLKDGKIEVVSNSGEKSTIVKNQTVLVDEQGNAKVLELASSGTDALSKVTDSIAVEDAPIESMEKSLRIFDASYAAEQKTFEKTLQFRATNIGDTLFVPSVTLTARATPGIRVTVWGETDTIGENGIFQKTFTWDDSAYGTKRFLASCGNGRVEVACFMWVTEYVEMPSANSTPEEASSTEENESAKAESKDIKLSVKINGGRNERVHLDLPATELKTNLKFSLSGISSDNLDQLKSLVVLRNGKPFKTFNANDLTSLNYEVPITIARNKIADFEVVATLANGKNYRSKKTYEVYCLVSNHPGGKARNSIVPPDQEYERLKQSGGLSHE